MRNKKTVTLIARIIAVVLILLFAITMIPFSALAEEEVQEAVPLPLTFTIPEWEGDVAWRLTDGNANSRISIGMDCSMTIAWPEATEQAGYLYLQWHAVPTDCTLIQYDAAGAELKRELLTDGLLNRAYPLSDGCTSVELLAGDGVLPERETEKQMIKRLNVENDARLKKVVLTEKALELHLRHMDTARKLDDMIEEAITSEEKAELIRILDKIRVRVMEALEEKHVKIDDDRR